MIDRTEQERLLLSFIEQKYYKTKGNEMCKQNKSNLQHCLHVVHTHSILVHTRT